MAWRKISNERVIDLYFLKTIMSQQKRTKPYSSDMHFPLSEGVKREFIFEQDGAPSHYFNGAKAYLDRKLPDRWIDRGGPILWPRSFSNLSP